MRVRLDRSNINDLLRGSSGPVVRQINSYSRQVANAAKQRVGVDSGRLRSSIQHTVEVRGAKVVGRVGSLVDYARYHHDGTGIYGPTGRPIRPRNGKFLVFPGRGGGMVFAREVQGSKPNPFLVSALEEIVPWPVQRSREG